MTAQPEAPAREPETTASPLDQHASPVADRPRSSGRATAAMVLGIVSIPTFFIPIVSVVLGILAIVIGSMARNDARRTGARNAGQAKTAIVCGIAGLVLAVGLVIVLAITRHS